MARWRRLPTDPGAVYDRSITLDAGALEPMITYGTNPGMGMPISSQVPDPDALSDPTALHEPSVYSSRWIEDGSFVRLQNITVEYDLSFPALNRYARSAKLYVSADNVFLITGYSGLDPEVSSNNEANPSDVGLQARGIDYLSYPRPRIITGGLRLVF